MRGHEFISFTFHRINQPNEYNWGIFTFGKMNNEKNLCIMYILQLYHAVNKNNQQQKIIYTLLLIRKSNRK